jgi:hypothetical protein
VSLAWKIVLSAGLPVALIVGATGAGLRSLAATDASARRTFRRAVLVVRETGAADDVASTALRLHDRWRAFQDPVYEPMWVAKMDQLGQRLVAMSRLLESELERRSLTKATQAFARYRTRASMTVGGDVRLRVLSPLDLRATLREADRGRRMLASVGRALETTARRVEVQAAAVERDTFAMLRGAATLAGVLAVLLSGWAAIHVTRAVRRLAWASEALERGRLDEPVGIGGGDELARLGSAFETLAIERLERDRVGDELAQRLRDDLDRPLRAVRDATRTLAAELAPGGTPEQRQLAAAIDGEAERLLLRATHIGDTRPAGPEIAYDAPREIAFDAPALLVDRTRPEGRS